MTDVFLFTEMFPFQATSMEGAERDEADVHAFLDRAMVLDTADHLSGKPHMRVTVWTLEGGEDAEAGGCSIIVQQVMQAGLRVEEAVRIFYERNECGKLVVMLGRNPLYPPAEIVRASLLLDREDDAVVFAASGPGEEAPIVLLASRRHHSGLFTSPDPEVPGLDLHSVVASDAIIHPLRAMRTVSGRADLPWLMHEVEREVLLGHWYPRRTYEALKIMKRRHIIPEVQ